MAFGWIIGPEPPATSETWYQAAWMVIEMIRSDGADSSWTFSMPLITVPNRL
jgi:hypothetical protein